MTLSNEELRLLEQMERALSEEDPKFASTLRGTSLRRTARRRAIASGFGLALGVVVLFAGAIIQRWYVGVIGFVLMLTFATIGLAAIRSRNVSANADPRPTGRPGLSVVDGGRRSGGGGRLRSSRRGSSGSFMQRMEDRWRRRREQGGF